MYGILLEGIQSFVVSNYGEDYWQEIREAAECRYHTFETRKAYSETIILNLFNALADKTSLPVTQLLYDNGAFFVGFLAKYGYDKMLRVMGRHLRDFCHGIDNVHEYLRFSYPKIRPPTFIVAKENERGLVLLYKTKRPGFHHYARGILQTVAKVLYQVDVDISIVSESRVGIYTQYCYRILFDNQVYRQRHYRIHNPESFRVEKSEFLDNFPFCFVLSPDMKVSSIGKGFRCLLPSMEGSTFEEHLFITRPFIECTWEEIYQHRHNVFEVALLTNAEEGVGSKSLAARLSIRKKSSTSDPGVVRLKGQMIHIEAWNKIIYIATPMIRDSSQLQEKGLYLNDLSMHDCSREMVMAGNQQSEELMELLQSQQERSREMEIGMRRLDEEKKRANELLYQCMPRSIARALRRGVNPLDLLKSFDQVSILFSKIVDFPAICMEIEVSAIVQLLNLMYSRFDEILEKHRVYKVETISDSYLIVSGAPIKTPLHAAHIAEMAFDMNSESKNIANPADRQGGRLQLQIGCHSGGIAAGIVGLRMPRYCLFGDTVNVSSRMMSHGAPGRIHVSENFQRHLRDLPYRLSERGRLEVKGKGGMTTYFLEARERQGYAELRRRLDEDRDRQPEIGAESGTPESRPSTVLSLAPATPSMDGDDDDEVTMKIAEVADLDGLGKDSLLPSLPPTPMPPIGSLTSRRSSRTPANDRRTMNLETGTPSSDRMTPRDDMKPIETLERENSKSPHEDATTPQGEDANTLQEEDAKKPQEEDVKTPREEDSVSFQNDGKATLPQDTAPKDKEIMFTEDNFVNPNKMRDITSLQDEANEAEKRRDEQADQDLRQQARSPTPNAIQKVENFIMAHPLGTSAAVDDADIPVDTGADDNSTSPSVATLSADDVGNVNENDLVDDDELDSEIPSDSAASYTSDPQPHLADDLRLLVPTLPQGGSAINATKTKDDDRTLVSGDSSSEEASELEEEFDEGDDRRRGRGTGIILGGANFVGRVYTIDKKRVQFNARISYRELSPLIKTPASDEPVSVPENDGAGDGRSESPPLVVKALSVFLPKNKKMSFQANLKEMMNMKSAGVKTSPRVSTTVGAALSDNSPAAQPSTKPKTENSDSESEQQQQQQINERRRRVGIVELAQNPLLRALQQRKAAEEAAREHEQAKADGGKKSSISSRSSSRSSSVSTFRTPSARNSPSGQSLSVNTAAGIIAGIGPSRLSVPQTEAPGSPLFSRRSSAATTGGSVSARQTPQIVIGEGGSAADIEAKQSEVPRLPDIKLNQRVVATAAVNAVPKEKRVTSEPARSAKATQPVEMRHPASGGTARQPADFQNTLSQDNFHILEKKLEPFVVETPENSPESTSLAFDLPHNDEDCSEWKFCATLDSENLASSCQRIRTPRGVYGRQMKSLGAVLSQGLAELAEVRPADPIEHLGLWLRHTAKMHSGNLSSTSEQQQQEQQQEQQHQ